MSNDLVGVIEAIVAKPIEDQSDLTTNQKSTNIDGLSALPLFGSRINSPLAFLRPSANQP